VKDIALLSVSVIAFAVLVTIHCAIVYGLAGRPPRWRALVAFVVVPLAPYWALRERMRFRAGAWVAGAVVYCVSILSQRL
jgi:hypothetical protein